MPWFKIDDKHHDHKKTRKALRGVNGKRRDAGAMGLWELAGSWSADNLMDGFVPTDELFRWDDNWESLAQRLVDAGYWEAAEHDGEPGFQFINWDEHQPMKAEVEAKREAAKERMRNLRSGSRSRSTEVRANIARSDASSSPTPSRPVPTRPDQKSDSGKPPTKAHRLPDDWQPSEAHATLASDRGVDLAEEVEKFRDWAASNGTTKKDWEATFRNWLRNARAKASPFARPAAPRIPHVSELTTPPDGLSPDEYAQWEWEQRQKRAAR